jgi:hypothetical protein
MEIIIIIINKESYYYRGKVKGKTIKLLRDRKAL